MTFNVEMIGRKVKDLRRHHPTAGTIISADENLQRYRIAWPVRGGVRRTWKQAKDVQLINGDAVVAEFVSADAAGITLKIVSDPYLYGNGSEKN